MTFFRKLEPGDRIVITALPDGFIYHVETLEGVIRAREPQARSFGETVTRIEEDGLVP